jgi:outer membrane receptor for ferrienterochelin and colicins
MVRVLKIGMAIMFAFCNQLSFAVQDTIPKSLKQRQVITGQFAEKGINEIFEIVRVISRYEIDAINATTLRDVLVHEMNAFVVYTPREGFSLNFQGTGLKNIKILLNGVPVLPHSMDIQDVSQFNLNNIERIEILEGPSSVMYGTHAVSTVINLIPFPFQDVPFQSSVRGSVSTTGDYNIDGRATLRLGHHDLQLYAGRYFFGGLVGIDSGRVMQWKPRSQQFVNLQYRYRFYRGLEAFAMFNAFRDDTRDRGYPINQSIRAHDHQYLTLRSNLGFGLSGKLSKYHTLDAIANLNLYRWRDAEKLVDLQNLETWPVMNSMSKDTFYYNYSFARAVFSKKNELSSINYQLGLEYNFQKDKFNKVHQGIRPEITQWAAFGVMTWQPNKVFGLKGGIRSMYSNKFRAPLTPEVKLKYDLTSNFSILAAFANSYRVPTFNELFSNGQQQSLNIKGNLNLKVEVSNNYYASLLFKTDKARFYTTFFIVNRVNGIDLVPLNDQVYTYKNKGILRYLGNRITLETTAEKVWFKLGLANTGINSLPGQVGNYYFYQEFLAQINIKLGKSWAISSFNKLQGQREDLRNNSDLQTEYAVLSGFVLSDLSIRKTSGDKKWMALAGVKNLFNNTTIRETVYFIDENDREILNRETPQSIDYGRRFFITINYKWR